MSFIKDPIDYLAGSGLFFEINRKVLHPLSLRMGSVGLYGAEKPSEIGSITISRVDPTIDYPRGSMDKIRLAKTIVAAKIRIETRRQKLGFVVQDLAPDAAPKRAYEAYSASIGSASSIDRTRPKWEDLPVKIQQAWRDVANAVLEPC